LEAALFSFVEAVITVSNALMLGEGGRLHGAGLAELGTLVAFIQDIQKYFVAIGDFSAKYAVTHASMTAAESVSALVDLHTAPVLASGFRVRGPVGAYITRARRDSPRAAVEAAAAHPNADGFIHRLGAYAAPLRDPASNLSRCQRPLIAFARSVGRAPTSLVL